MKRTIVLLSCVCLLASIAAFGVGGATAAGEPPLADAGLDQQVPRNATVLLDAAGSRDPDGTIRSYRWTIETPAGRTIRPANASAPRTSFVARQRGRYEVTVTVWDGDGYMAADTLYVDVGPPNGSPDPVDPTAPDPPATEVPATPGGPSADTVPTGSADSSPTTAGATGPTRPSCPAGERYLTAFDTCAGVSGQPPTIAISGPTVVAPGSSHTFTAEASDFPDGIDRIEWGSGESGAMVLREFPDDPGRQVTLHATVYDGEGNSRTARHTVYVGSADPPPKVEVDAPAEACVDQQVTFEGTATPRAGDTIARTWWPGPGPVFTPGDPGVYSRTFKASDDDGQSATETAQVRVTECQNMIAHSIPAQPEVTDRIVIMGTDTHLQRTREVANLTRRSYGEDASRMAGGGFAGAIADMAEGTGHVGRNFAETVTGQEQKVLKRAHVNESLARRAVALSQKDYDEDAEFGSIQSPKELFFADDRALNNPTVVDGLDPDADRYVIVVKQSSRQNIVNRIRNGREDIDRETAPIESTDGTPSVGEAAGSGWTPIDAADPAVSTGELVADRASDVYNEGRTFADRLLDDGNSPEEMAGIVGTRVEDSVVGDAVEATLDGGDSAPTSTGGTTDPVDEATDTQPSDATAEADTGTNSGGGSQNEAESDGVLPDPVSETIEDVNPLSDSNEDTTGSSGSSGGGTTTSSDTDSSSGSDDSNSLSWSLPGDDSSTGSGSTDSSTSGGGDDSGDSSGPDLNWDL